MRGTLIPVFLKVNLFFSEDIVISPLGWLWIIAFLIKLLIRVLAKVALISITKGCVYDF